jgi:glycosyltransferase involved in cell wall biosynthesis
MAAGGAPVKIAARNIIIPHGFEVNYTMGFVKGLQACGVDFCVLCCDSTEAPLQSHGISCLNLRGSLDESRPFALKMLNLASCYARTIFFLLRRPKSTIHFSGIFRNELILVEGILLNLCFRVLSQRYIYTVHNVLPHSRQHSRLFRRIYRLVYQIPDLLLVTTQRAKRQLIDEFSVPESKIEVMSIGLNEEMPTTSLTRAQARQRLGFGLDERLILFFGKMDEYKGLDLLMDAFEQLNLPQTTLLAAGSFRSEEYRKKIHAAVASARHPQAIRLQEGHIPNAEVEIYFKAADALCLPYRNIYQSGVVFLALSFGIPVVATDVGSLREFVDEKSGLITRTNDAAGLAEALRAYFADPGQFNRREIADGAKKYRWENVCRALVSLYQPSGSVPSAAT